MMVIDPDVIHGSAACLKVASMVRHRRLLRDLLAATAVFLSFDALAASAPTQQLPAPWLPLDPGATHCDATANSAVLSNAALRFAVAIGGSSLRPAALDNGFTGGRQALRGELFSVMPRRGKKLDASAFRLDAALSCHPIVAEPGAARAADRHAGSALSANLTDPTSGLQVSWHAVLREGSNYVREEMKFESDKTIDLASVTLIDLDLAGAWVDGTASGSPLVAGNRFYAFEHPMAQASSVDGHASASLRRVLPLRGGVTANYSAVLGVVPQGQLRRGFQAYVENERAAPFHTFLHYNSWYDIGFFNPYTQDEAVNAINQYGRKLVRERGVTMDSFLFDDGWDNRDALWQFSKDFPHGFTPVREAAEKYGADPGMWLSPWGGYGQPRTQRLAAGKAGGYEEDDQGLALSGPKYYALFHRVTLDLLKTYAINQFKFDGTGSPDKVTPGSDFDSDFAAAIALIGDLRAMKPDLFINLTTGTWPSPFWLRTADSIWRGGEDHSFAGVGSNRQRWITYRDADTYGGIVRQGPLFPLNSLMLHGIIYARKAQGLATDPDSDFADEVHSYFATGTGLQEMYISPDLLTARNWDTLAAAAKWARANAVTLRDSHWIGGDPVRLEVYGWGSWSPGHAIVSLRNPSDHAQTYALDIASALELPKSAAHVWTAKPAFAQGPARPLDAGKATTVALKPFEVLVWDLVPAVAGFAYAPM
jgi:hypothetical protein